MDGTTDTPVQPSAGVAVDALLEVLDRTVGSAQIQELLLQRLVTSGDVIPSRIPAPLNITEIGGYLNLLEGMAADDLRSQMLASILGVAGPLPASGLPTAPILFFASTINHRPAGAAQSTIPLEIRIRSDLTAGLSGVFDQIAAKGAALPILGAPPGLPPLGDDVDDDMLLAAIGRQIRIVPATALTDPDADPVAVARPDGGGDLRVVARVIDDTAPEVGDVVAADWTAFTCDADACTESTASRRYLEIEPLLAAAGWHHGVPSAPVSLGDQGRWDRFDNVTGLISGETTLGDELALLYTDSQLAASSVRTRLQDLWDGTRFVEASA
jgi:hypothetical protein